MPKHETGSFPAEGDGFDHTKHGTPKGFGYDHRENTRWGIGDNYIPQSTTPGDGSSKTHSTGLIGFLRGKL